MNQQDVESLINNTLQTSVQEDILANQNDIIPNTPPYKKSFKSPGKALLYSGVLPGMGQVYMRNWMHALLFVSIDVNGPIIIFPGKAFLDIIFCK